MEKNSKLQYEMPESCEVREYIENMLKKQTDQIKEYISDFRNQQVNEELERLKLQLGNVKSLNERYENEIKKKEGEIANANKIIEGKKLEIVEKNSTINEKDSKINELYQSISTMELTLQEREKRIYEKENENKKIITQNQSKTQELSEKITCLKTENQKIGQELKKYSDKYSDVDCMITKYASLSFETKNRLHNIITNDSIFSVIAASYNWKNIEGIWDFTKRRVVEKEYEDVKILGELFEFLLNAYNDQNSENKYALIKPTVGDKFDSDIHSIIGIQTDGFVRIVHLPGIEKIESNKIIKKALIEVEG